MVVPGYTDDDDSAHRLGQFIKGMDNIEKVELLPYHQLGEHKWEALGYEYELKRCGHTIKRNDGQRQKTSLLVMVIT